MDENPFDTAAALQDIMAGAQVLALQENADWSDLAPGVRRQREQSWCGREDSNFHGLSATATSTLRVYQFRHDRT